MDEDIKETLENVKRHLDYVEATKQCSIRANEMKAMYNYITNLQKENEIQKKDNESLKKFCNDLVNKCENLIEKYQDYKQRNEKAVEYIKIQQKIFGDYDVVSENQLNNLLNILQGGDE